MAKIYGVDTSQPYTLEQVRNALVECFLQAHESELKEIEQTVKAGGSEAVGRAKRAYIVEMIRKFFREAGGDFDKPTRETIVAVCDKLKDFAANFRQTEVIDKHYNQMMELVKGLD